MRPFEKKYRFLLIVFAAIMLVVQSCFTVKYSTSGASISPDVKTVSISTFQNRGGTVRATMAYDLTNKLREKIEQNTKLYFVTDGGDVSFEGEITGYTVETQALQSSDKVTKERLKVTVNVKFVNTVEPQYNFSSSFSRYEDYDVSSGESLESAENRLFPIILDNLAEDIFNKAFTNW
ncbi:MAG TPA: LptE family protein [Bacteroidales bacterium]|nr:LptE family protein [Bacteroidales bacterium]